MLSLCMIVRNEEANLPRALASVRGLVDEMVLVDTGSTDRTVEIAASMGARVDRIPWTDDFAAARNHSLSLAKGDWILVLDADDDFEREDIPLARKLVESTDAWGLAVRQTIFHGAMSFVKGHLAFFRNRRDLRYAFRVHERLPIDPAQVLWTAVRITHRGYGKDQLPAKLDRNRRLLEMMKGDRDPTARVAAAYYLGSQLILEKRLDEARREFAAAASSDVACDYRLCAVLGLAQVSAAQGDLDFAASQYGRLLEANPGLVEAELGLAAIFLSRGRADEARAHFEVARTSPRRLFAGPEGPWEAALRRQLQARLGPVAS